MSAAGVIAIMLVAGACHAGWNLLAKQVHTDRTLLLIAASAVIVLLLSPWGLTHLPTSDRAAAFACVVARGGLNLIYLVGLSKAYRYFDLSFTYPLVRGTGPVVATFGAVLLLGERPAPLGFAGIAVLSVAILALAATGRRPRARTPTERRWAGGAVIVLTGATIGVYTVVDKIAVRYWNPAAYFWGVEAVGLILAGTYLLSIGRLGDLARVARVHLPAAATCAALIGSSYILALVALQHSLASYVAPLRETSVLFGALLGMVVLKEGHGVLRITAAAGIAGGLLLIGLAI